VSVPAGFALGVTEDIVLAGKDTYLTANADVSADAVYEIVKLLWERIAELETVHPLFGRWTESTMTNSRVTLPFHEGTIRWMKEIGAWTPRHEQTQRKLLAGLAG